MRGCYKRVLKLERDMDKKDKIVKGVEGFVKGGHTVKEACKLAGVSTSTYYRQKRKMGKGAKIKLLDTINKFNKQVGDSIFSEELSDKDRIARLENDVMYIGSVSRRSFKDISSILNRLVIAQTVAIICVGIITMNLMK